MKTFHREIAAAAALLFLASSAAQGKGLGGPIRGGLMFREIEVVAQAHVAPEGGLAVIIDKSYLGPYKAGERVPVEAGAYKEELLVPGSGSQPEMFLVLTKADQGGVEFYGRYLFAKGLQIDTWLSRRISNDRVYGWSASTKESGYWFWRYFTNTAPLGRDPAHADLAALEADAEEGISRHEEWTRAQAATAPAAKLALLRPFLLPGEPHELTPYELWGCRESVLEEVEKAGPASVPFLEELLTEPSYQSDYAPNGWLGFGAEGRAAVRDSLALVQARAAGPPQEKLTLVRPVFEVPQYDFRAGTDPVGMVWTYLDRALAIVSSTGATDARPFLQSLLALPQFQKGARLMGETSLCEEMRTKIEAALAALR